MLWQSDGPAPWYFVSLPSDVADDTRAKFAPLASSFGSKSAGYSPPQAHQRSNASEVEL